METRLSHFVSTDSYDYANNPDEISLPENDDETSYFNESEDEDSQLKEVTRRIQNLSQGTFFPDETNVELKERVQTLKSENTRLKRCVRELETQLNIKSSVNVPKSLKGINNNTDLASSKIVELAKKVRELNAKLASAENRANKAEAKLFNVTEKPQIKEKVEEEIENDKEKKIDEAKEEQIKDLTEKLNIANKKLFESKNEVQQLKHELKLAHKTLSSEIGDEASVQTALTTNGWRGRAQQILTLEKKVSELTEKLSHTNIQAIEKSMMNMANTERQADKEKINALNKELQEIKTELSQIKGKNEAAKARIRVLSSNLSENKGKVEALTYKTNQDEQMISRLSNQLSELSDKHREREDTNYKKFKEQITELESSLGQEKVKSQQLKEIIDERESRISRLEEKCTEQRNVYTPLNSISGELPDVRPLSRASSIDRQSSISSTSETERLRLMELVGVLNKRVDDERRNLDKTQDDLRRERHKGAKLETKLAKLELTKVGAIKGYHNRSSNNSVSEAEYEKVKDKCELLEEKCLALESRLDMLRLEKEEEARLYQNLLDEVKLSIRDQQKVIKTPSLP